MKNTLLVPATFKKDRLYLTLLGSVAFHATLIGLAAVWPSHAIAKKNLGPTILIPIDSGDSGLLNTPGPSTPEPVPEPLPTPMEPAPGFATDDTPPLSFDPEMVPPALPVPSARPTVNRTRTGPAASSASSRAMTGPAGPRSIVPGASPGVGRPGVGDRWNVSSKPPYPTALKKAGTRGSGTVRVATDASGRVVEATMVQSTGSSALDENTTRHARAFWTGPGNATTTVPITYQLQ